MEYLNTMTNRSCGNSVYIRQNLIEDLRDTLNVRKLALHAADEALSTWFSSEYTESAVAKQVREALK